MSSNEDETTVAKRSTDESKTRQLYPCLLVLTGRSLGKAFRLEKASVSIGRGEDSDVRLEDDGVSRQHAKVISLPEGLLMIKDLNSTNGTYVNEEPITAHPLADGDRIRIGATTVLKFTVQDAMEVDLREQLYNAATRDALTGAQNRRAFEELMARDMTFSRRHKTALSVVLFDIDHFKKINDTYGHTAGDEVLKQLVKRVQETRRVEDTLVRLGGEEFCVVLAGTPEAGAVLAAERLRLAISRLPFEVGGASIPVTVSLGVAQYSPASHLNLEALMHAADQCLYEAKRAGRNRVASDARGPSSHSRRTDPLPSSHSRRTDPAPSKP